MAEYRKYLFDNFVVDDKVVEESSSDEVVSATEQTIDVIEQPLEDASTFENDDSVTEEDEVVEEEPYNDKPIEPSFTQEDIDDAVAKAKEEGYAQGLLAGQESESARQNALLEEIKNKLSLMFAEQNQQNEEQELDVLKFIAASLRKLLPTLEKIDAVPEIKKFLDDNFTKLSSQKSLAFFFNPDMAKSASPLIEKAAAHNDFEGKISIHKDENLGLSDCRIEWADGYVERNTDKLLERLENLLTNNQQERENG